MKSSRNCTMIEHTFPRLCPDNVIEDKPVPEKRHGQSEVAPRVKIIADAASTPLDFPHLRRRSPSSWIVRFPLPSEEQFIGSSSLRVTCRGTFPPSSSRGNKLSHLPPVFIVFALITNETLCPVAQELFDGSDSGRYGH